MAYYIMLAVPFRWTIHLVLETIMASVYIETTIPSYYFESRQTLIAKAWREATRLWWEEHREKYRLCTSRFVLAELREAPSEKSTQALALLDAVEIVDEPEPLFDVADYYVSHRLMPA